MPHVFDGHGFGQLLNEAERLFAGAQEHHLRLAEVVTRLARDGAQATSGDTLTTMHRLLTAAEEQRELAGTVLTRLIGSRSAIEAPRRRVRVLIVDDSEGSRETAAAILEEAGFEALTASNGLEGVIVAHYALPAVVLMDLTMPVLSGLEATRLLRASLLTRNLKVIAFTARPDIYEESLARSFADVLTKPAAPETIITTVQRCVSPDRVTDVGSEEGLGA